MRRMYLLPAWFSLSDEDVEDAVCDSYAMRRFLGLDFTAEQVPDATTLLHFQHLLESQRGDLRGAGLDHARRQQRGRDDHHRAVAGYVHSVTATMTAVSFHDLD